MSGVLQLGYDYSANETKALSVDSSGKLDIDVQVDDLVMRANDGNDGAGTDRTVKCDANGVLQVATTSTALPTGAATEATLANLEGHMTDGAQVAQIKANTNKDGSGTSYSPLVDADGHLQVDVLTGGGGGTQYDAGDALGATPTGTLSIGKDGSGNAQALAVDTSGNLQVDVLSSALPTGAATQATLTSVNTDTSLLSGCVDGTELQVDIVAGGPVQHDEGDTLTTTATGNLMLAKNPSSVADALNITAGGALRVDEAGISTGADATLTSAQQVVAYGRDSGGNLDALKVDNAGHLEVVQDLEQQTTSIFSGTQAIAASATHTFTTTLDKNGSATFDLLISSSTSAINISYDVKVDLSDDDSTYYEQSAGFGTTVSSIQNAQVGFSLLTPRYARVSITNTGTVSLTITSVKATRINGL